MGRQANKRHMSRCRLHHQFRCHFSRRFHRPTKRDEEQEEEEGEWEDAVMPGGPGYRLLSDEVLLLRRLEEEQSYPSHPQHNPDNYGVHFSSQSFERADSKFVERILQAWSRNTGRSRYRLMCVLRICRRS